MADTVSVTTLHDGARNLVVALTSVSDGTGEDGVLKVDVSTFGASEVVIDRITYSTIAMSAMLYWDADVNVVAAIVTGSGVIDAAPFGGIKNTAQSGKTGDILLTTQGAGSGETYFIILEMTKK